MGFGHTISKGYIKNFIDQNEGNKSNVVKKIQDMKNNSMRRLITSLSEEKMKFIDPNLIKGIEKEYFEILTKYDGRIDKNFDYTKTQKEIEKMFKKHNFEKNYIGDFNDIKDNSLLETPKSKLKDRRDKLIKMTNKQQRDYDELKKINKGLFLLDDHDIQNTKSRTVLFDQNELSKNDDKLNTHCFFEEDKMGNKNYFSMNELLNDLETFGVESGYPILDPKSLGETNGESDNIQKLIKKTLLRNIFAKYRDYQEVVMYNFVDYEKHKGESGYENKPGILAEKVVERSFRDLANVDGNYEVKVKKASVGEDQKNKVDLIIQIEDKKTGINIEKELQLTINHNKDVLQEKKKQINRQKIIRDTDLELLDLELNGLNQKMTLWRNLDRPIGGLNSLLSIEDKELLEITYNRIVEELNKKNTAMI